MYQTISTNIKDGILTLMLDRPEVMNAFTHQMKDELLHCFEEINKNDDVRVVVVTGNGRAFCAGMDFVNGDSPFTSDDPEEEFRDIGGQVTLKMFQLNKPIIAAINGPAVGIGMTMTLPMDIRIMKKDAKIGFVFGLRGIGPESAAGWFLPRIVGIGKALEWTLTGRYIPANEALQSGLVQYVEEEPLKKAYEIAEEIVRNTAATSTSFSRQLLWQMLVSNHPNESHLIESKFLHWAGKHEDSKEGIQSFFEKRKADFKMKASDVPDFFHSS